MRLRHVISALPLLVISSPALAEVSDKIPSLSNLWGWAIAVNVVALTLSLWRTFVGLTILPLSCLLAAGSYDMLADPYVGSAILSEQGQGYVTAVYRSSAIGLIGPVLIVGLVWLIRRKPQT